MDVLLIFYFNILFQVEDLLHIEPLLCLEEDDMLGLVPNLDLQNFNPEPPIYALRFCPVPGFESILGLVNEDGNIAFQDINQVRKFLNIAKTSKTTFKVYFLFMIRSFEKFI